MTLIYIDKEVIADNFRLQRRDPPVMVQWRDDDDHDITWCMEAHLTGPSKIVYRPHKMIVKSGASLVISTDSPVVLVGADADMQPRCPRCYGPKPCKCPPEPK